MSLFIFFLILSILVLIHEFGHFIVAKKNGVHVEEFGLGLPPRLFGKKIGDTLYSFNWLPFGGFVKLYGDEEEVHDVSDLAKLTHDARSFMSKSPARRSAILLAGVFMNMVLALVLYLIFFLFTGFKTLNLPVFFDYNFRFGSVAYTKTVVAGFPEESPMAKADVHLGEAVVSIDGNEVSDIFGVKDAVKNKIGTDVNVVLRDLTDVAGSAERTVTIMPIADENGEGILGVYLSSAAQIEYKNRFFAPIQHSYNMLAYTGATLSKFVGLAFETRSIEPVSATVAGPIGIYSVVDIILSQRGLNAFLGIIDFMALMSLTLAFMNVLPLPALDGGRFLFIVIELILGRRVNYKIESSIHKWGMLFFLGLLLVITVKDIAHIM